MTHQCEKKNGAMAQIAETMTEWERKKKANLFQEPVILEKVFDEHTIHDENAKRKRRREIHVKMDKCDEIQEEIKSKTGANWYSNIIRIC